MTATALTLRASTSAVRPDEPPEAPAAPTPEKPNYRELFVTAAIIVLAVGTGLWLVKVVFLALMALLRIVVAILALVFGIKLLGGR